MVRKLFAYIITGIIVMLFMVVTVFINYVGTDNLDSVYLLSSSQEDIVFKELNTNGHGEYLTKHDLDVALKILIERMANEGWNYVIQEGATHYFEKDGIEKATTIKVWNKYFHIYVMEDNVVNIEDQ